MTWKPFPHYWLAVRQLNALARISKYLDQSSLKTTHNSLISSNFSYCALVWHFCGKVNNEKIEKIQERSLRILQNDYTSSYHDMLRIAEMTPALIYRLRVLTLEVFKSLQKSNPPWLIWNQQNRIFDAKSHEIDATKKKDNELRHSHRVIYRSQYMESVTFHWSWYPPYVCFGIQTAAACLEWTRLE